MRQQLVANDRVVPFRIARRAVHHVNEDPRPLDMTEERVAEPGTTARALDEPRHVRDGRSPLVVATEVHDAEVRLERRERVVRDLRRGRGESGEDRRLSGIREADEPDVGDQPEIEPQPLLRAGLAFLGVLRRLVRGGLEVRVSEAAAAAAGDEGRLADGDQVRQKLPGLIGIDRSAGRDVEVEVVACGAMTPSARAAAARRRPEMMSMAEVSQRGLARIDAKVHRPTAPAVAPVWTTAWDVRLLAEGRGPVATIAGADPDLHAVEEHRRHSRTGTRVGDPSERVDTPGLAGSAPDPFATGGRTPAD
jgi:hypothetical protein